MQFDPIPFSRPTTPGLHPLKIGWYGLGAMGYFMARNIATSRQSQSNTTPVLLYNRTLSKAQKLADQLGPSVAEVASSPAQLATECDVIFTNLANDAAVQSVYNEFAKALSVSRFYTSWTVGSISFPDHRKHHPPKQRFLSIPAQ